MILHVRAESDTPVDLSHLNIILVSTDFSAHVRSRELEGAQYEVSGLSAGEHYNLNISSRQELNFYVKSISAPGVSFPDRVIDADRAGADPLEVLLSMRGGTVSGTVADAGAHVTVLLIPEISDAPKCGREANETTLDHAGSFTFRNIAPGKCRLLAWNDLPSEAWRDADFWSEMKDEGTIITVAENGKQQLRLTPVAANKTKSLLDRIDIH